MKKMNSIIFWSKNFSWKRKSWTKTFRKMKRNKSERFVESVERDERRYWKIDWKIDSRMLKEDDVKDRWKIWNSCHGHIFIISWWLKSKLVTLGNFYKTSHLKKLWLLKKSSETSHLKNCDFWKCIFQNQSLVIDFHKV